MYLFQCSKRLWPLTFPQQFWPPLHCPVTPPSANGLWGWNKRAPQALWSPTIYKVSAKFVILTANFKSLNTKKIRTYKANIICIHCKGSYYVNNKSRACKYYVTALKRKTKNWIFVKIYDLLSFVVISNLLLLNHFFPSTWSSSILPSHSLPLKPILLLCHSLIYVFVKKKASM